MKHATTDPKQIALDADKVAKQHADFENAESVEADAYLELLHEVMNAALPALPAISSAVPGHDLRGLQLLRGDGEDVWWLEQDEICRVTSNTHNRWSTAQIVDNYGRHGVVDAIVQISAALDAQLRGGKSQSIHRIQRRADQIRALAVLVRELS